MYFSFRLPVGGHCPYRFFSGSWALPSQLLLGSRVAGKEGWALVSGGVTPDPVMGSFPTAKGQAQATSSRAWKGNRSDRGNGLFHKEKARKLAFMPTLCYLVTQTAGRTIYQSRLVLYDLLDLRRAFYKSTLYRQPCGVALNMTGPALLSDPAIEIHSDFSNHISLSFCSFLTHFLLPSLPFKSTMLRDTWFISGELGFDYVTPLHRNFGWFPIVYGFAIKLAHWPTAAALPGILLKCSL